MATPAEIQLQQQGIQNSEILLDLSNQLNNSITERRKLLKNATAEEQLYFATVKQQQKLSSDIAANAEKYLGYQIKSKDLAKQIRAVEDNTTKSKIAFKNVSAKLVADQQKAATEARKLRIQERNLARQILAIDENTQDLEIQKQIALRRGRADVAQRIQQDIKSNQLNASALEKRSKKLEEEIAKQKNIAKATAETIKNGKETLKSQEKEITFLKENERIRKRIEKSTGLLGAMSKAASKLPGIGQYLNADEAIDEMEKLAAKIEEGGGKATSFGNRILIAKKGLNTLIKGAYENLKSPEAVFTFFLNAALTANDQAVKLGKSLGYGADRADDFREKLAGIARSSTNINVTTANLVEAFGELSKATGFAYEFTADQLETQVKLTKQVGLTADEAAQVQRFAVLNNKTSEETYKSFLKGITAARNQLKVGIDFKATLAEASKVSGQLAAQLGNNPELIGKAVVSAKALGMTLEQVAKAGSTLLDFGTSIGNELEAELLTGKQLNLERARAAALAGDQITLAEELAKNMGTAAEFTKLNKLQQDSLAKSIGMSSDELAETLRKREEAIKSGKSLAQITEEEAKEALERQTIQEKFNQAILKLQDFFGNLVAGPIGQLLDSFTKIIGLVTDVLQPALNIVFKPLIWAVSALAKMEGLLKVIGGIWLSIAAAKKIALGYDIAMKAANQISANLGLAQIGTNRVKLMLEKESLLTRIAGNIQLFRQLTAEHGVMAALRMQFGLQQATNVVKQKSLLITIREFITTKATAAWDAIRKTGLVAINALKSVGAVISKREALFSIASAAMDSLSAAVSGIGKLLGPLAIPIGIAAAAGVASLGYNLLKADDLMSEGGYGKRTLLAPEGAFKLNDNDTVLAGTDFGGGEGGGSMPQIDLTSMIAAINEVRAAVNKLYNKDQSINMDGKKVGTTLVQGSYKVA